jgi:hypothetical protein
MFGLCGSGMPELLLVLRVDRASRISPVIVRACPLAAFALRVFAQRALCAIEIFFRAAADNLTSTYFGSTLRAFFESVNQVLYFRQVSH